MPSSAASQQKAKVDLGAVTGVVVLLLLLAFIATQVPWYFYNERHLNRDAVQSPEYQTCAAYFNNHLLPNYQYLGHKQCRDLVKFQLERQRGYFTHSSLQRQKAYITPLVRRDYILKYRKDAEDWTEIQNSPWLP